MKKTIIPLLFMLFALSSCWTTRRHIDRNIDTLTAESDSMAVFADSVASSVQSTDTTHFGAALDAQQTSQTVTTETDSSRIVIVTEYGDDGKPVRQTETRQNAIVHQQNVSLDMRLQIDAYLEKMRQINEQYDEMVRRAEASKSRENHEATKEVNNKEVSVGPSFWSVLLWLVGLIVLAEVGWMAVMWYRRRLQ